MTLGNGQFLKFVDDILIETHVQLLNLHQSPATSAWSKPAEVSLMLGDSSLSSLILGTRSTPKMSMASWKTRGKQGTFFEIELEVNWPLGSKSFLGAGLALIRSNSRKKKANVRIPSQKRFTNQGYPLVI
jgi:hypothetical protein